MYLILLGIIIGILLPVQTAVNTQLRKYVNSPFIAGSLSFSIATILLIIVALINRVNFIIPLEVLTNNPPWIWLGGIIGAIWVTTNIFLFQKLGSVQAIIMPLVGQIIMSMLIDNFGWFNSMIIPFDLPRLLGVTMMSIGVVLAVVLNKKSNETTTSNPWPWRLLGIGLGFLIASQAAINGQLGIILDSKIHAGLVSFATGAICIILVTLIKEKSLKTIVEPFKQKAPKWIWLGGVIGAFFVVVNVTLVGAVGTGQTIILVLFGQITGSLLIENYGLFRSHQSKTTIIQMVGLIIMFIGIVLVEIL